MKRAAKITVILSTALALVLAASAAFAHLPGRDLIDPDKLTELQGTLAGIGTAWTLETADGTYLLHLGNRTYLEETGARLENGKQAAVQGYLEGSDLVATRIDLDGESYRLRDEEGIPLWAGNGRRSWRGAGLGCHDGYGPGGFGRGGRTWRQDSPRQRGDGYRWER